MFKEKMKQVQEHTAFASLSIETQSFLQEKAKQYNLSFQDLRQLVEIGIDLQMWQEEALEKVWIDAEHKKPILKVLRGHWQKLKELPKHYEVLEKKRFSDRKISFYTHKKESVALGSCPVASAKTRCCNLLTLDAVESCGFDCSYCSIQSFYNENKIGFDANFKTKLENLELDKQKIYHIGTGQSSDSLMWGNKEGILDALFAFAKRYPNVILELKSKSNNISYLLEHDLPKNIITTWSLNPQVVIDNEEHLAASLEERIQAAKKVANKGGLVGFHFHPMVLFDGYEQAYSNIAKRLVSEFSSEQVALVSMGTLTFIKPVLKKIRQRANISKILQMPLTEASGKLSYPLEQKEQMFKTLYNAFLPWHEKVFFYMCMEDVSLWKKVFGYEFNDNDALESAMTAAYKQKIEAIQ